VQKLYFILLLFIANLVNAQSISTLMGARAAGIGNASSGFSDEWSLWNNHGGLGRLDNYSVGSAYEARPWLNGANRLAAAVNAPLKWGAMAAGMFRFGDDLYSEQMVSIGAGNQLGIASLGAKINVVQYRAEGIGVWRAMSVDFGGITQLTEKLTVNAYIFNLNQAKINRDTEERLPTRLTAGFSYRPSSAVFITSEISKELTYDVTWRTGLEYTFQQKFFFRTGFNLHPTTAFFGLGAVYKKIKADYALQVNTPIGPAHQGSFVLVIPKAEKL
jgi:hypothetical protein